ncbi:MAG: hypothetical protein WBG92_10130 [Thiohalocapsa sp.]
MEIALGQCTGVGDPLLVEQKIALPWSIGFQDRRRGLDQWLKRFGGGPGVGSVVEHNREDRRQATGDTQLLGETKTGS